MQQARRTLSPPTMQCVTVAVMGGYDILRGMQFPRKSHLGGIRFPRVCDPGGIHFPVTVDICVFTCHSYKKAYILRKGCIVI